MRRISESFIQRWTTNDSSLIPALSLFQHPVAMCMLNRYVVLVGVFPVKPGFFTNSITSHCSKKMKARKSDPFQGNYAMCENVDYFWPQQFRPASIKCNSLYLHSLPYLLAAVLVSLFRSRTGLKFAIDTFLRGNLTWTHNLVEGKKWKYYKNYRRNPFLRFGDTNLSFFFAQFFFFWRKTTIAVDLLFAVFIILLR